MLSSIEILGSILVKCFMRYGMLSLMLQRLYVVVLEYTS
jgi:hypothetical protein